jgi:hypothetical protein
MNRERDFDQTLKHWLDDGAYQAPERYVWAALEEVDRTGQRGAWGALLEGTIMKLKPAAPILGVAAVVLLAIAAFQYLGGNVGGPSQPTAQPSPTPLVYSGDLANLAELRRIDGMEVDDTTTGYAALTTPLRPGGEIIPLTGFEEALMQNFGSTDTGGYVTWAALYVEVAQAEASYDFLITEHAAADGWGMERSAADPDLGDESALMTGAAYGWDSATTYLWRRGNVIFACVGVGDADPNRVGTIATTFDQMAH